MDWYKTVNDYYKGGFYTKDQVTMFVVKGKITPEQFKQITDEVYLA